MFSILKNPSKYHFSKTLEMVSNSNVVSSLHNFLPETFLNHLKEKGVSDSQGVRLILYLIVRKYKPEIVIETGVADGLSSAFILCAMHENDKGNLYSIDLPPYDCSAKIIKDVKSMTHVLEDGQRFRIQEEYSVGHLVPEYLKEKWILKLGDAKKELPILLKELNEISIFFHDSLHTYKHMRFEYETSWPFIEKGGFLISHDVVWNKAFREFAKKVHSKPTLYYSLGVIKKS